MKTIALLLLLATPAVAASEIDAILAAQAHAIPGCIRTVRAGSPYSQFDAFPKSDGIVSMFGSPLELFAFQKCMAAAGFELEDIK